MISIIGIFLIALHCQQLAIFSEFISFPVYFTRLRVELTARGYKKFPIVVQWYNFTSRLKHFPSQWISDLSELFPLGRTWNSKVIHQLQDDKG